MPPHLGAFVLRRLFCLFLIGLVACNLAPAAHAQNERLVLAFYYAWFDPATWSSGKLSDQPAQPYDSRDRATIQRHVAQAKAAGIDALVQSWYGPSGGVDNMTESNFAALLDAAAQQGLRAAVDFETTGPFFGSAGDAQGALATLLAGHARHPAYLKVGGRPVIFFWRQQRFSVDEWAAIRQQVDPSRASIWIAEGVDLAYLRVFDGIHLYSVAWSADPATALVNFGAKARKAAQDAGGSRYWVATAMPGYDDLQLRGGSARARDGGAYYRASFSGATKSGADWVIITSYNEWLEGTQIEPSLSYGDAYLNLTRELAAAYKSGAVTVPNTAPALPAATVFAPAPAAKMAQAVTAPTATQTVLPSPTATTTHTPLPTFTLTPSATAPTTPRPTTAPTDASTPTETPMPLYVVDDVPVGAWAVTGAAVLLLGVVMGGVWARRARR
jgi:hypothetical protein